MKTRFFWLGKNGNDIYSALGVAGKIINAAEPECPTIGTYGTVLPQLVCLASSGNGPVRQAVIHWMQSVDGPPIIGVDRFQMNDATIDNALDALRDAAVLEEPWKKSLTDKEGDAGVQPTA